ncbi:MAG: energy-coupling factor transporter transmembrane protein EcfT, partial [Anaerolineales bacterium]|nr:energy-coupling factor transporter transmembrane protein EcfT [Anaerolineales bacterium]
HRLDPRAKLVGAFLFVVAISIAQTVPLSLLVLASLLGVALLARIPIGYLLRGLLPSLPVLVVLVVLQLAFRGQADRQGQVLWEWWFLRLTTNSLTWIGVGAIRIVAFIFLASLLTLTTTTTHLTHGMEYLLGPLKRVGFPAHELALVLTIAFRFVPTLVEELDRVAKAQASRLGNIGEKNRWRPDKVVRARLPLIVPLFLSALRRGEDLILAMEARCYVSGARRSRLVQLKAGPADALAVALMAGLVAAVWWLGALS